LLEVPQFNPLEYKVIKDKRVILDDEKAAAYIELPVFRGERLLVDANVQTLFDAIKNGTFNPLLVILSSCEFEGTVYKINGQHTCWAKYYCPGYEPEVREIAYKVATEEQLKHLYASYDRGMARSNHHLTMVELSNVKAIQDIPISIVKFMAGALKFWLYKTIQDRRRVSPADVAGLIAGKHLQLFRTVCGFFQHAIANDKSAASFMRKHAIGSAMLETFSKVPTVAPEFWRPVCDGIGLDSKIDARWQLRDFLQKIVINGSSSKTVRVVSDETVYNHCVPAFNKWRRQDEVRKLMPSADRVRAI
jgi:hypothetical protein